MKYRPCLVCAVVVLAAVGLCVFLHNQIAWILTAAGITLAAVFLFLFQKDTANRITTVLCLVTSLCCIASFGTAYHDRYEYALTQTGAFREIRAYVLEPTRKMGNGSYRYLMQVRSFDREEVEHPVELYVDDIYGLKPQIGDLVHFYAPVERYYNRTPKDTTAKMLGAGVFLVSAIKQDSMAVIEGQVKPNLSLLLLKNKHKLCELADASFTETAAQVFKGMLYGDKRNMAEDISIDFRYSGFAHLLAVSGLHIQVIFMLVSTLLGKLLFFVKARKFAAAVIGLVFIWAFICLIGFPVSAVRSGIMVTVSTVGLLIRKRSDTLNSLGISVVIIELLMPFSLCELGFWLSVLATFGIGSLGGYFYRVLHQHTNQHLEKYRLKNISQTTAMVMADDQNTDEIRRKMLRKRQRHAKHVHIAGKSVRSFIPGVSASVGLMPFYLFYFGYLPLGSVIFGPLLGFLFEAIVLFGVLFTVSGLLSFSAGIAVSAWVLQPLLTLLEQFVAWVADISFLILPLRFEFAVVFTVFALLGWIVCSKKICRMLFGDAKRLRIGIFLVSFYVLGLLFTLYYQYNIVEVAAFKDPINGCVVVTTKNKATVFVYSDDTAQSTDVLDYLRRRGVLEIDKVYQLVPYNGIADGIRFWQTQIKVVDIFYNSYGLPAHDVIEPIRPGDAFLNREILLTFDYVGDILNVSIRHGETNICIIGDVSDCEAVGASGSNVVILYDDDYWGKANSPLKTDCLVLLSEYDPPYGLTYGRVVQYTGETTIIEFDLQGEIHLP